MNQTTTLNPDATPVEALDHILENHHMPERRLWKEIDPLMSKVLVVHYEHGKDLLLNLHRDFNMLRTELEGHFAVEERELFPLIESEDRSAADEGRIRELVIKLKGEHSSMRELIAGMQDYTRNFTVPDWACGTMAKVMNDIGALAADVLVHLEKEETSLYSRLG